MPHPDTERMLDAAFPRVGPCLFCGRGWARHRMCDMIRSRHRAGDSVEDLAEDYNRSVEAVRVLVSLSPSAYGWWLRNEGRQPSHPPTPENAQPPTR